MNYTCTVVDNAGTGSTFWRGTAFNCPPSNIISLSHQLFNIAGDSGTCNNGAITAESVGVVDNCYTSRLMVTVSSELNETTVECTLVVVGVGVGNRTLLVAGKYKMNTIGAFNWTVWAVCKYHLQTAQTVQLLLCVQAILIN